MNHWMCDDKFPVLPLRDLRRMSDGRPPEPKGNHFLISQKGSNYFLRVDPNSNYAKMNYLKLIVFTFNCVFKLCTYAKLSYLN